MTKMTKTEFLSKLTHELYKNKIADTEDIISEYEQHFAFKLADGFSEEEICAKLGEPVLLASQFENTQNSSNSGGKKFLTITGLCISDLFVGAFFVLLALWVIVMVATSVVFLILAVCLFGKLNIYSLIPEIPYWCGVILGISSASLAVLSAIGCIWFAAFLCQLVRSFSRFHHHAIAAASGNAILPALTISPQFSPKTNRRMRSAALIALALFAASFVLAMIASMLSAGAFQFWHVWGWFGYTS